MCRKILGILRTNPVSNMVKNPGDLHNRLLLLISWNGIIKMN